jgi:hypothetical protein
MFMPSYVDVTWLFLSIDGLYEKFNYICGVLIRIGQFSEMCSTGYLEETTSTKLWVSKTLLQS